MKFATMSWNWMKLKNSKASKSVLRMKIVTTSTRHEEFEPQRQMAIDSSKILKSETEARK